MLLLPGHLWKRQGIFLADKEKRLSFILGGMLENFFDKNTQL